LTTSQTQPPICNLEARYYTDPNVFAAEQAGLLSSSWQFAGHAALVRNPGDYFTFEIAGENLFCIKGQDGQMRAFYNVCQHRAHEFLTGQGTTRVVVCPYHAWTYELTGALRAGPNINAVIGFDKSDICLTPVRVEDFNGFLFVNLDENAPSIDQLYPGVRQELREFVPHIDDLAPLEWVEVAENCNWKVSVENYSECYHCTLNHPTSATGVIKPDTYDIRPDAHGYVLRHITECQSLDRMTYPIALASNPRAGDYRSWFLWPMFSFQVYPGNVLNTYHWRADRSDHCLVTRGWYSIGGQEDAVIRKLAVQDCQTTVAEDITLVESVRRGLRSKGYRLGPLVIDPACGVYSEHSVQRLQQWMREAVDG
jgi:phenylpropionate dioxygenase-like ring-hydroxylating dioxygenase large terminal subunit